MSTPQAKRRRMNEAAKTLHKPFKSPFRRPAIGSDPPSSDPPETLARGLMCQSTTNNNTPNALSTTSKASAKTTEAEDTLVSDQNVKPQTYFPKRSQTLVQRSSTKPSLTREIMHLRSELQILSQAQALAISTKDDDLIVLIDKWRTASRAAAEELFATTRDKVNRMGGVGAWNAREKESKERQLKWDQEEMEAQREKLDEARESGALGDEEYDRFIDMAVDDGKDEQEEETFKAADDDSFTMDMMLKTLNIDLNLIGYNKEAQRWEG